MSSILDLVSSKVRSNKSFAALFVSAIIFSAIGLGFLIGGFVFNYERIQGKFFSGESDQQSVVSDSQELRWNNRLTGLLNVDVSRISFGKLHSGTTGGALEQFQSKLIYVSGSGMISSADMQSGRTQLHETRVPMNYLQARNETLVRKSRFNMDWYRTLDLFVWDSNARTTDLYASHHLFSPETKEMCVVLSRIEIALSQNGDIQFGEDGWETVFKMRDCLNLEELKWEFFGNESGGRIERLDDENILLSIGSFELEKYPQFFDELQAGGDSDLGKLIKINTNTKAAIRYAGGLRNPQGLVLDEAGRLWETEHGPRGGDELNLIEMDGDYGWPNVTYGVGYGGDWPFNPEQGKHEGFIKPKLSFVPSIGISNVIEVPQHSPFERWRGDLVIASLKAGTLFRVRHENGVIRYIEPIAFENHRLRDLIVLENGWIAALALKMPEMEHHILVFKPTDTDPVDFATTFTGFDALTEQRNALVSEMTDYSWGRLQFQKECSACHRLNGESFIGPALSGIVNDPVAGDPEYQYSAALSGLDGRWTRKRLLAYVNDPQSVAPGSTMAYQSDMGRWEAEALIDFLEDPDLEIE